MRLICLLENESYGGAVQMLMWVAQSMAARGHQVAVYTMCQSKTLRRLAPNCDFVDLGAVPRGQGKRSLGETLRLLKKLRRMIADFNPDIVLNFGDHAFYDGLALRPFCRYRYVISERIDPYTNRGKNDLIRRKLYNLCDGAVFQTRMARDYFGNRLKNRSTVIANPVKISTSIRWSAEAARQAVCFVGRLENYQKRVDVLLEAFAKVHQRCPQLELDIFGTGTPADEAKLAQEVRRLGVEGYVNFRGRTDDVLSDMKNYQALVFTSDFEGIPNVIIEGMSIGIPIVATDCTPGGAAMLLEDGKNGILVGRGDVDAIAEGVVKVLTDRPFAVDCGQRARASLSRFREADIAGAWEKYLLSITRGKRLYH